MLTGGCFCGFVRYRADDAVFDETNCHCSICRRTSGAPFVPWFSVRTETFAFVSGEPKKFSSSSQAERTFCPRCGTPLTFSSHRYPNEIDITICSLDDPEQVQPKDHTRTSARLSWVKLADGLPNFPEGRVQTTNNP